MTFSGDSRAGSNICFRNWPVNVDRKEPAPMTYVGRMPKVALSDVAILPHGTKYLFTDSRDAMEPQLKMVSQFGPGDFLK